MLSWKKRNFLNTLFTVVLICLTAPSSFSNSQIIYESGPHLIEESGLEIVDKNGKLGLVNGKGIEVVPAIYRKIRINKDKSVSVLPFTEWLVLDGKDQLVRKLEYDFISPMGENLLKVRTGKLEALSDEKGNLLTEMRTWNIFPFNNNYALVKENELYGIINAGGKVTVPVKYDTLIIGKDYLVGLLQKDKKQNEWHALQFSGEILFKKDSKALNIGNQGYFSFLENSSWGFFNYQGVKAIPNQYDLVQPFVNGQAIARYLDSDGVINRNGEWLIKPRKDHLYHLKDEIYLFRSANESGLISTKQGELFTTQNQFIPLNYGFIEKDEKGKVGLISPEGKRLLTTEYDEISSLQNDTVFLFRKAHQWGIITKTGKIKLGLNNPIQKMYPMGDQFIGVKIDNKYGFVDINGDLRIANRYEAIGAFHENMAAVKLLGKWGFVDRIERLFVQPLYDEVFPFENGLAIVKKGEKYGLVNRSGEEVLHTTYDSLFRFSSGRFITVKGNKQGLADKDGRTLIYPKYDAVNDLDNGYVIINRNNKYGLVTTNGISTIPLIYDSLIYNPFDKVYFVAKEPKWKTLDINSPK